MRVQTEPSFQLGYHRNASHQLLPVEQCPISSATDQRRDTRGVDAGQRWRCSVRRFTAFSSSPITTISRCWLNFTCAPAATLASASRSRQHCINCMPAVQGVVVFVSSPAEDDSRQFAPLTSVHDEQGQAIGNGDAAIPGCRSRFSRQRRIVFPDQSILDRRADASRGGRTTRDAPRSIFTPG